MFGHYLPNKNEGATVAPKSKFRELNKGLDGYWDIDTKASFRSWKNFTSMNSSTFVLFGKYCPIVDQLGSKDSSRDFQLNYVISYFFTYI